MEDTLNLLKEIINSWTPENLSKVNKEEIRERFSSLGRNTWATKDIPNYLNNILILLALEAHNENS